MTGATSLNNNQLWDDPNYLVPMAFGFTMFGRAIDLLSFDEFLGGGLIGIANADTLFTPIILPFDADLIDRGDLSGVSQSPLSYKVDGLAGNKILKIEWNNAGSFDEADSLNTLNDYVNFQLWLYESSHDIEFHYGPSSIANETIFYYGLPGPIAGIIQWDELTSNLTDVHLLQGSQDNPTLVDSVAPVIGTPADGTIYKFTNQIVGMDRQKSQKSVKAYPNPVDDILTLTWAEQDIKEVVLYNSIGKRVYGETTSFNSAKLQIDLSGFSPGMYYVHIRTGQVLMNQTIVKL
ncbi:MAG TPA: T9SS type A sorting domain-containing protein [Flavobacteriales bacterium]|nr:T9SS type A sorting domain-containing protein [Flavobacteriales bacterium]